jgi:hypothetical protein
MNAQTGRRADEAARIHAEYTENGRMRETRLSVPVIPDRPFELCNG